MGGERSIFYINIFKLVVILLLNLLIAMMGDTYAKIAEIKNEWMRQVSTRDKYNYALLISDQ